MLTCDLQLKNSVFPFNPLVHALTETLTFHKLNSRFWSWTVVSAVPLLCLVWFITAVVMFGMVSDFESADWAMLKWWPNVRSALF